jgi:succinoglycan biosynthesis transport protein ExoP
MKNNRENRHEGATSEVTLRDAFTPLFRHRKAAIVTFCAVFALAIGVAWVWAARYYQANMQVVVEQDRSDPAITSAQVANVNNTKQVTLDQVTSEVTLLQGEDMLRSVVTSCHLADGWSPMDIFLPFDPQRRMAAKKEKATRNLEKKIKVEAETTSDVIDVKYGRMGEPEAPACVLQTLGKLYLEKHLQLQRPAGSSDFFTQETEKYRQALAESEKKLVAFSADQRVAAPDLVRTDMAQQLALSESNLYQAQQSIAADQKRIDNVKAQMAATPARSSTTEVSNASNILMQNLQASLLAAKVKRTQLLLKYDANYPLVREAEEEIAETEDAIAKANASNFVNRTTDRDPTYEYLRQDQAKTEADLAAQHATAAALVGSIRGIQTELVKLDQQAVTQAALLRETKADEGNYLLYLGKREQERTSDALDQRRIANVAIAVPAVTPILPKYSPFMVMFLGLVAAVFVGIAAAYVMEYLDPSFRTPQEVSDTLSMPVLATMPKRAA